MFYPSKHSEKLTTLSEMVVVAVIILGLISSASLYLMGSGVTARSVLITITLLGLIPLVLDIFKLLLDKRFGVDVLALIAIISSLLVGEYVASAIVVLMLSGGKTLEKYAQQKSAKELRSLVENAPKIAHFMRNGVLTDIPVGDVNVGDKLLVRSGEVVPVDGIVSKGTTQIDESVLTGEPNPVDKIEQSKVYSGTINRGVPIEMQATKKSDESSYSHIIRLVDTARFTRAPFIRLADRYSLWFTAFAFLLAIITFVTTKSVMRAVAVLVVATPCPLILATPIAFVAGMAQASRRGVIIKHGDAIEKLARAKSFLFDKTGTLTFGTPRLTNIRPIYEHIPTESVRIAASLDQFSNHILARSLVNYVKINNLGVLSIPKDFREDLGGGVAGMLSGDNYLLGRLSYLEKNGVRVSPEFRKMRDESKPKGIICVYLAKNGRIIATFEFADTIRDSVKNLFAQLRRDMSDIIMVTGDKEDSAKHISQKAGMTRYFAECLPDDKVKVVMDERKQRKFPVVMVGDGINDAPALASADVGIAMGAYGASASTESGDIVIMVDSLEKVGEVLSLSKNVLKIAKQGVFVGMGLSVMLMILASMGYIMPVYGAVAQEFIDIAVILNALRVRGQSPE
jgi:heavy metal translocating P-type ATPase